MTGIDFLNKVKDNWENVFIDFLKKIIVWDISKWNRGVIIWDNRVLFSKNDPIYSTFLSAGYVVLRKMWTLL